MKKRSFLPTFFAAIVGGVVVAIIFLIAGVGNDTTRNVIQADPTISSETNVQDALTVRQIYRQDAPGVVFIRARVQGTQDTPFGPAPESGEATGSGFVLDKDGFILTNAHVIQGSSDVRVGLSNERGISAKIIGTDPNNDLALIKIDPKDQNLTPLQLGDSNSVQVGDPTVAIGNPFGLDRTLTTGVVSALQRKITAPNGFSIENVIQTDAAINTGNSGGPLINSRGQVIGINSQIATPTGGSVGIGFAVPSNTAKKIIPELKKTGKVERGFLGITGIGITPQMKPLNLPTSKGVLVESVEKGTPADKAGLRGGDAEESIDGRPILLGGDIIEKINGKSVETWEDLLTAISGDKPGKKVSIELIRDAKKLTVTATLAERPERPVEQ